MANDLDIFGMSVNDLDIGDKPSMGSDLYSPKPDQGVDGTYSSLIRFLPNLKNPRKPFVRKFVYWLEDEDGNGFYVDSPSTVGDNCPVQDLFFKLRNSDSAVDNKLSEKLKRREVFYSLIQIVKDPQNPDLEGQIKVYKFGWKIKQKIDEELNPKFDEPVQVFDPFEGKNFELVISKKAGFPNYDSSKFQGKLSPMTIDGKKVSNTDAGKQAILAYLEGSPELETWDYTPWSPEERKKVTNVLHSIKSPGSSIDTIVNNSEQRSVSEDIDDAADALTGTSDDNDDGKEDDLDDFIDGLDL